MADFAWQDEIYRFLEPTLDKNLDDKIEDQTTALPGLNSLGSEVLANDGRG